VTPEPEQGDKQTSTPRIYEVTVSTVEFMPGLKADVHAPSTPGNFPVVTLTFGRGWSIGDRSQMTALSHFLASRGVVAVNGEYRTLLRNGRLPSMVEEVACLAAAAPEIAKPHLTGPSDPVWLLGYSAGAHLAALATLTGDPLPRHCPHLPTDKAGMIGLGGPYDLDELWNSGIPDYFFDSDAVENDLPTLASVLRQGDVIAMQFFLHVLTGLTPEDNQEWDSLSPIKLADQPPQRSILLVTGGQDELIYPLHAERFAQALESGGHLVDLRIIPHTDHGALSDPAIVGEEILSFVKQPS
jgi:acetyl esterase/lipase